MNITFEEAKKMGCHYCDLRHSNCGYPLPYDFELKERKECPHFILGKCFSCAIRKGNNGEPVLGICDDAFDFAGCENYKS